MSFGGCETLPAKLAAVLTSPRLIERELCERSLVDFAAAAWRKADPSKYVPGWHIEAVCDHLEAVSRGEITRLIINVPPRHTKSLVVAVHWPAWVWTRAPERRWLFASYAQSLSVRDSIRCRRVVDSPWYRAHWGDKFRLTSDQNTKIRFDNDKGGYRLATSVDGALTGEGGDIIVVDDPHNVTEVESELVRQSVLDWWDQAMSTRLSDPKTGAYVIVMQRVHEADLTGHILARETGWDHLCLPARYEPAHPFQTRSSLGWSDTRNPGELLWPERFGEAELEELEIKLGQHAPGQLQQRPSAAGGGILERGWWQFWTLSDPPDCELYLLSFDTALKEKQTQKSNPDFTAMTAWGVWRKKRTAHIILLHAWQERLTMPKLRARAKEEFDKWTSQSGGDPPYVLIEDKGSGSSLIQELHAAGVSVWGYNPGSDDKVYRANMVAQVLQDGVVWAPGRRMDDGSRSAGLFAPFAEMVVEQCASFPNSAHDDLVDTVTQALTFLRRQGAFNLPSDKADDPKRRKKFNYYGISSAA